MLPFFGDSWRPSNSLLVFLGNEGSYFSAFPFYPTAKVGDFGLAERTNGMDPNNPRGLQGAGTRAYMAPVSSWCDKSAGPWRLSSLSGTETSPERGPRLFLRPTWDLRCSYQCMGRWRHYVRTANIGKESGASNGEISANKLIASLLYGAVSLGGRRGRRGPPRDPNRSHS